jgi:hypothetical protein
MDWHIVIFTQIILYHERHIVSDELIGSPKYLLYVIPAKAGIQGVRILLDSRFHGSDRFFYFLSDHNKERESEWKSVHIL